jgi:hypothetical protein
MASDPNGQAHAGPWLNWDGEWKGRKPVWRQSGRSVPSIPAKFNGADMRKPVDPLAAQRLFDEFAILIDSCGQIDEQDTNVRILDAMDAGRISPPQAEKLLKRLFRKFDGGPGMCRIDSDGNVIPMEATDGQ